MTKKLTDNEKQEIRDRIERLKHLKKPYIKTIEFTLPVFVALFILAMGMVDTQTKDMFDVSYNISLIQNNDSNLSHISQGTIEPIKNINPWKILRPFETIGFTIVFAYIIMALFIFYLSKYTKYDNEITRLYNKLIGLEIKNIPKKESRLRRLINKIISKKDMKKEKKNTLEDYFKKNNYSLIVLSIFLLVTLGLVNGNAYLNNILALLSALMTYFVLIGMNQDKKYKKDSFPLWGFEIVFPVFIVSFCAWVVLNIVITLTGEFAKTVWGIIWLIFMIYPSLKFWIWRKN
jgi:hypothetical protein